MAAKAISQPSQLVGRASKQTSRAAQRQHKQLSPHWAGRAAPSHNSPAMFLFKTSVAMSQSISVVWVLGWKAYDKQKHISVTTALQEYFWGCPTPSHMAGSSWLFLDDINTPIIICDACRIVFDA